MASAVDPKFPPDNVKVSKALLRALHATVESEITELQAQGGLAGQLAFGDLIQPQQRLINLEVDAKNRVINIPTIVADSGNATDMTEAILFSGIHVKDPTAAISYQVPTGTQISTQFAGVPTVGDSFEFTLINEGNVGAEDITLTVDTGVTFKGSVVLAPAADDPSESSSATWIVRNTGANTWVFYRK